MDKVMCQTCDSRMDRLGGVESSPTRNFICRKCGAHDYQSSTQPRKFFTKEEWDKWVNTEYLTFTDSTLHERMNYPRSLDHIEVGKEYKVEALYNDTVELKGCDFTFHISSFNY